MALAYRAESRGVASGGASLTVNKPAGTADGDVLIAYVHAFVTNKTITPPAGWTQRGSTITDANSDKTQIWTKRALSEPASQAWTQVGGTTAGDWMVSVVALSGGTVDTFFEQAALRTDAGNSTTAATDSITAADASAYWVAFFSHRSLNSRTLTVNSPYLERVDVAPGIGQMRYAMATHAGGATTENATGSWSANCTNRKASIIAVKAPTATEYTISPSGAIASSGKVVRAIARKWQGALTPSAKRIKFNRRVLGTPQTFEGQGTLGVSPVGTLRKQTGKRLAGTLASAGVAVRRVARSFGGSIASSSLGQFGRAFYLNVGGAIAPQGGAARYVAFHLAGTLTAAAAAVRETRKPLGGTTSPTGSLQAIRIVFLLLAGAIAPEGSLARQIARKLAGAIATAGSLRRQARKQLGGVSSPAGALLALRTAFLSLAGVLSTDGRVVRRAGKHVSGQATPAGRLSKLVSRLLAGTAAASGSLSTPAIRQLLLEAELALTGALQKLTARTVRGVLTCTATVQRLSSRATAGVVALATSALTSLGLLATAAADVNVATDPAADVGLASTSGGDVGLDSVEQGHVDVE